jgi:protein-arginine kinase activator protein McsA
MSNVLNDHIRRTHTQHVDCEICNKTIQNPKELQRHKVFVHNKTEGAWLCEKCPKSAFFSQSTFEKHVKTKH